MTLRGRIAVEPLDEERLTNIERRVVAGAAEAAARGVDTRARHRAGGRLVLVAAMVIAGAIGWLAHRAPEVAGVASDPVAVRVDTTAPRTVLDLGDARIARDPATRFDVTRPAGGVLVALERGRVELDVDKRHGRPPLIVRAGDTDVIVVGTHFTVDYRGSDVAVRVTEGVVRVVRQQRETRVAAGQRWNTHGGLVATTTASAPASSTTTANTTAASTTAARAIVASGDAPANDTARPATDAEAPATDATHAVTDAAHPRAPDVLHDRKAAVPDAPSPIAAPHPAPAPARPLGGEAVRPHAAPRPVDPHVDLHAAIRAQPVLPALDIGEPDPASAVAKYYAIAAHTSGEDASGAFYSIAVIRHTRLGRNADALQALDAYVRRFPGGKEYRAALWLRVRILCLDKLDDRCRAAAYTYLHEAPDEPAAHVAELVTLTE